MTHDLRIENGLLILNVAGPRLDAAATPALKAAIAAHDLSAARAALIEVGAVEFMDSTGLGALVSLSRQLSAPGRLALAAPGEAVRRLFSVTGLDKVFTLADDAAAARDALGH